MLELTQHSENLLAKASVVMQADPGLHLFYCLDDNFDSHGRPCTTNEEAIL